MKSEAINELASALAKAQAKIRGAVKDSANPFFKSSYADLQSVWDAVREPLAANGLAVVQTTGSAADGKLELITTLMHSSGQWIEGRFPILPLKQEPQAIGSATSYARRYALAALVGVYQTDDDGEQAQARGQVTAPDRQAAPKPAVKAPAPKQKEKTEEDSFKIKIPSGDHAGKMIEELTLDQAKEYFESIDGQLKSINRPPATLIGDHKKVYYGLIEFIETKKSEKKA